MASFKEAFDKIAEGVSDLTSLEVTTYKGKVELTAIDVKSDPSFDKILASAGAKSDFSLIATTKSKLDGDTIVFYDKDATAAEISAHNQLVDSAATKRTALVQLIQSAIAKVA